MLSLKENTVIYVADQAVDCRKAINGLSAWVLEHCTTSVNDGSVYIFYNREGNRVKCLFWDKNGFVLYHKRLERGRFKFSKTNEGAYAINQKQLSWLLAGLDFQVMQQFSDLDFTDYF